MSVFLFLLLLPSRVAIGAQEPPDGSELLGLSGSVACDKCPVHAAEEGGQEMSA